MNTIVESRSGPPIFMFGYERSGTTLLSMLMGAHPDLAVPFSAVGLWYRYWGRLDEYGRLGSQRFLEEFVRDILSEERIQMWDVVYDPADILRDLPIGSFAAVVDRFHTLYAKSKRKSRWGNVDIATLLRMDQAAGWFPDARFIHIVRDGRDVTLSHDTYKYGAGNTLDCAENWYRQVFANLKMGAVLGRERYLVIKYEDVLLDTEASLAEICEFSGLEFSREMLSFDRMVKDKIPESRRELWPLIGKPLQASNANRWRTQMSESRRAVFERNAGSMLAELGYETYARPNKSVMSYLYELGSFLNRGKRLNRLWRRVRNVFRGVRQE